MSGFREIEKQKRSNRNFNIALFIGFSITMIVLAVVFGLTIRNLTSEHEFEWYASQSIMEEIQNEYDDEIILSSLEEVKNWTYELDYKEEGDCKLYIATVYETGKLTTTTDKWLCIVWYFKVNGTGFNHARYECPDTDVIKLA